MCGVPVKICTRESTYCSTSPVRTSACDESRAIMIFNTLHPTAPSRSGGVFTEYSVIAPSTPHVSSVTWVLVKVQRLEITSRYDRVDVSFINFFPGGTAIGAEGLRREFKRVRMSHF